MNTPKRNRARVLTPEGLKKLREQIRSQETEENAGTKYTLEKLGELTGLDPETVKHVLDCKGSDKRTIARCFESFGLTLAESDHIAAAQATVAPPDPNFVGREGAIADLDTLVSRNAKVIVIQARGGVGKTTLARKYLQQAFGSFLEFPIAKETKDIASIEGLIEEKLRQLGEEPGREFLVSLDRLKRKLQADRIGILIDNLEPALDSAGRFIEAHRRYVELLRVLSDPTVQSVTLITSRERLREADVTVQHYPLRSLDVTAWEQFFQSRSIQLTPLSSPGRGIGGEGALAALHNAYGGNAKAMDIISGAVLEDFAGDVEAYWQANQADLLIERDLEDLVIKQFERLQQLDSDAYNLLCRMGCYRYQDVPTVPIEGLFCLLWDVPENRHRRVIKSLQDRSLVDFENGEFWLHPVIRAEAIGRLRTRKDWEMANCKAGELWTNIIQKIYTVEDAVRAFEAYYHYLETEKFEDAGLVILRKRPTKSANCKNLELGRSFCRLGLIQQAVTSINLLASKINSKRHLSNLYNVLAVPYRMSGNINQAIKYHEEAIKMAEENLNLLTIKSELDVLDFKTLKNNALLNIGFCKLDLWELEEALEIFLDLQRQKEGLEDLNPIPIQGSIACCLAFLFSFLQPKEDSLQLVDEVYLAQKDSSRIGTGFKLIFLGMAYKELGEIKKSFQVYHEVLIHAQDSGSKGATALALNGIAEVYREEGRFEEAIENHIEAIKYLIQIGAKGDFAKVQHQLGLTYRVMGKIEKSDETLEESIRLFSEMEAPKQVERVRQSMQNQTGG